MLYHKQLFLEKINIKKRPLSKNKDSIAYTNLHFAALKYTYKYKLNTRSRKLYN